MVQATEELRKLVDRVEEEALATLDQPSMERLAAFDTHRRAIDSTLIILRRAVQRRVDREQSKTEPDDATGPQPAPELTKRPTTRPPR